MLDSWNIDDCWQEGVCMAVYGSHVATSFCYVRLELRLQNSVYLYTQLIWWTNLHSFFIVYDCLNESSNSFYLWFSAGGGEEKEKRGGGQKETGTGGEKSWRYSNFIWPFYLYQQINNHKKCKYCKQQKCQFKSFKVFFSAYTFYF